MHLTQEIKDSWEMEEDPEYGYREEAEADVTLMSLEKSSYSSPSCVYWKALMAYRAK